MLNVHRILIAAAYLAMSAHAGATELLFSGVVQRQTVAPSGTADCARPCPANSAPDANGMTRVCISNAGGCQVVEITVLHDYLGTSGKETESFRSRTGEFGGLNFPNSTMPILVHAVDGDASWTMLTEQNGVDVFDPADKRLLWRFIKLHPGELKPDANGAIPVTQLVQRIQQ